MQSYQKLGAISIITNINKMMKIVAALFLIIASVMAFNAPSAARPASARMTMLFNFGKKSSSSFEVGKGTANKGTYVPEGLSKEAYEKALKAEAEKKSAIKKRFPKGKETESLTEWMDKEKKKGNEGKGLLLKGHRMVKAKYDGWYTDESPV